MKNRVDDKQAPKGEKRKRLGDLLIDAGLIDLKVLQKALGVQKIEKKKLGQILMDMGVVDDIEIAKALSTQLKIPFVRLQGKKVPKEVLSLVPAALAENYLLIPLKEVDEELVVAMANPLEFYARDDLRFITQKPIKIAVSPQNDILDAIEIFYPKEGLEKELEAGFDTGAAIELIKPVDEDEKEIQKLKSIADLPPVVRFVNSILSDAIKLKASDVHVEPQRTSVIIRYRIDGIMREILKTDKHVHASLSSRLKVVSGMDISVRRRPQDGRTQVKYAGVTYDLRVSSLPTSYGEKITLRILNPESARMNFEELGLSEEHREILENCINMPQGLILVTGPTGSGKSSTLYCCLNKLNAPEVNIVTVEDPVEFDIDGINQTQINPKAGITFATALRSILRQDPDIVMVGEIRDRETAAIACQAAQTGHLVLSTLHTNDAPSAITRLLDLDVDAFVVADSLVAVVGQRLVRRICEQCKKPDELSPHFLEQIPSACIEDKNYQFFKGEGCEACRYSGYSGRTGIYEILPITPSVQALITKDVSATMLRREAEKEGFRPIFIDGLLKAGQGLTTIGEVLRVAPIDVIDTDSVCMPKEETITEEIRPEEAPVYKPIPSVSGVQPPKVMVVEDSEIELTMLSHLLETQDYRIIKATNGAEALKLTFQEMPDLIVTDYMMPEMDGLTLIRKLKAEMLTRVIPVIMLTAKDDIESEVEVLGVGADDYLTKPVDYNRFIARVKRLLERRTELTER